jgi:hypothetical protein
MQISRKLLQAKWRCAFTPRGESKDISAVMRK